MAIANRGKWSAFRRLIGTAIMCMAGVVAAQGAFPQQPIKIVVGYPPGGGADIVTRTVANRLGQQMGASVVVENRPGASGMIAADAVAKSRPDGYTLIMMPADSHSIAPHVYPNIRYKALEDYTYLALIGVQPMALIVRNGIPASNIQEFIEYARKQGQDMTYATFGVGSSSHAAMAMLEQYGKFKLRHIPYQGSAPGLAAVMAGQVDAMMIPTPLAIPNTKNGKAKMIGIAAQKESSVAPAQPYFSSAGVPIDASVWVGIMAPKNLPKDIAAKLNIELTQIFQDEALKRTLENTGTELNTANNSPEFLKSFYEKEYAKWGEVVRSANIRAEE